MDENNLKDKNNSSLSNSQNPSADSNSDNIRGNIRSDMRVNTRSDTNGDINDNISGKNTEREPHENTERQPREAKEGYTNENKHAKYSQKNYDNQYYSHRSQKEVNYYDDENYASKRGRRAFSYVWNIFWGIILVIFFNFYSDYIAYYQYEQSGNNLIWHKFPIITSDFSKLVPLITISLAIIIIGNIILLIFDKYVLARVIDLISSIFTIAVLGNFLMLFPLDFNLIPYDEVAKWLPLSIKIIIGIIIFVSVVNIISNFVKIIINIAKK